MTRLLPLILVMAMAMGCAGPGKSPGPPPSAPPMSPAQRLDHTMDALTRRLALSPEQAQKVKAVLQEDQRKRNNLPPSDPQADPRKEMAKIFDRMRQIDQETNQELAQILTPEQMAGYEKYRAEERQSLHHDRRDGFGKGKPKKKNTRVPDGNLPSGLDPARRR